MASTDGSDGWLLNVEAQFPSSQAHLVQQLPSFIQSLKRLLGASGLVVWYDALTSNNEVEYQNALNWKGVQFALAVDLFFTNYRWSLSSLRETQACADLHGIASAEIFFGIDTWAQNTDMPGPSRITYPQDSGGGTLTGLVSMKPAMASM